MVALNFFCMNKTINACLINNNYSPQIITGSKTTFVSVPFVGIYFASILDTFVAFLVPAVVTVAIKTIFDLARD